MPTPGLGATIKNCKSFCHPEFHEAINLNPLGQELLKKKMCFTHPGELVNHFQIDISFNVNTGRDRDI